MVRISSSPVSDRRSSLVLAHESRLAVESAARRYGNVSRHLQAPYITGLKEHHLQPRGLE
jgi:hypothetical protein